jgi:hypothetical protein
LPGCGNDDGRCAVEGSVTLHGKPLDQGSIEFHFTGAQKGSAGGALIREGKYVVPREHGLLPGSYRVVLSAPPAAGAASALPGPDQKGPPPDRIPASYNTDSKEFAEIKAGHKNEYNVAVP